MILGAAAYASSQSQPPSSASSGAGQLKQVAYIKASNPMEDAHLGCGGTLTGHAGNASAISDDGNTIAMGAPHENSGAKGINGNQNDHSVYSSGAVYVFTRRGETVTQQAYIKASTPSDGANFGSSVALSRDGNTMAVAAYYESSAATGINGNENDLDLGGRPSIFLPLRRHGRSRPIKVLEYEQAAVETVSGRRPIRLSIAQAPMATLAVGAIGEDSAASGINGDQADNMANQRAPLILHPDQRHLVAAGTSNRR
jgi:hypothetical protein